MSEHDSRRLHWANAVLTDKPIESMTDDEIVDYKALLGDVLAGIQSTDDPAEEYGQVEHVLIDRLRAIENEIRRRVGAD